MIITTNYPHNQEELSSELDLLLHRIGNIEIKKENTTGGLFFNVSSADENIPNIKLLLNQVGEQQTLRCEIIGNINQYIVHEFIQKTRKLFRLLYLEVTDPITGHIKYKLSQPDHKEKDLYTIYKKEIFKFHYPREDGRLLILLDQGKIDFPSIRKKEVSQIPHPINREKPIVQKRAIEKLVITAEEVLTSESIDSRAPETKPKILSSSKGVTQPSSEIENSNQNIQSKDTASVGKTASSILILQDQSSLTQKEQIVMKLVEEKPNKKVQSKGLKKELSWDQDSIRDILRSLVNKNFLYVRAAWYIVRESDESLTDFVSEIPLEERLKNLTPKEWKIFDILDKRPGRKAQARMLIKETKMTKDNLKKLLRNMVTKDILFVYAAWYIIKE